MARDALDRILGTIPAALVSAVILGFLLLASRGCNLD